MRKEHGLKVTLLGGKVVWEKNNYWSDKQRKILATNWSEIDKDKIEAMALYWKGRLALYLTKAEHLPDKWVFSHTGMLQTGVSQNVQIVSRNIGFERGGIRYMFRVSEADGRLSSESTRVQGTA
jgi:hypothetical protein